MENLKSPCLANTAAIIGLGLLGGSLGLALKKQKIVREVVGIPRRRSTLRSALKRHAIDRGTLSLSKGVSDVDVVFVAVPVGDICPIVTKIKPFLKKGAIVTDVGSTKAQVVHILEKVCGKDIHFVGGHPMAGSEQSGISVARENLFENAFYFLTKTPTTNRKAFQLLKRLVERLGARSVAITPQEHDTVVAAVSHLPHLVASALVSTVAGNSAGKTALTFASTGFRDTTRIASSPHDIWTDICLTNHSKILHMTSLFKKNLTALEKAVRQKDRRKLRGRFMRAKTVRDAFVKNNL